MNSRLYSHAPVVLAVPVFATVAAARSWHVQPDSTGEADDLGRHRLGQGRGRQPSSNPTSMPEDAMSWREGSFCERGRCGGWTDGRFRKNALRTADEIAPVIWCRRGESNPHEARASTDFESVASASFATPAHWTTWHASQGAGGRFDAARPRRPGREPVSML